jgi:DNA polymerase-3 subunit delta'
MQFHNIEGHELLKKRLINIAGNNKIPHCQLLYGEEGGAGLVLALAFAKYIFCKVPSSIDSCGDCSECKKIDLLVHPDLCFIFPTYSIKEDTTHDNLTKVTSRWRELILTNPYASISDWSSFIGSAGKQMSILKSDAHYLLKWMSMRAFEAPYKIVIIWLPEYMTSSSANAFLKVLEEPSADTIFLLISNDKDKIIGTILSRTQQICIVPFKNSQVSTILSKYYRIDMDKAINIANTISGNVSKALELAKKSDDYSSLDLLKDWMRFSYKEDFSGILTIAENFQKYNSDKQKDFFKYAMHMIVCTYFISLGIRKVLYNVDLDDINFLEKLAKSLPNETAKHIINLLDRACYLIDRNANPKMIFINISLKIKW